MRKFQVSLFALILLPSLLFAANWLALSHQAIRPESPLQAKYSSEHGWRLYFPEPTGVLEMRSWGWPFAYQWGPFPDENLSLPLNYRSHGIKWLPLVLNGLIATVGALVVCWVVMRIVHKPAVLEKRPGSLR